MTSAVHKLKMTMYTSVERSSRRHAEMADLSANTLPILRGPKGPSQDMFPL